MQKRKKPKRYLGTPRRESRIVVPPPTPPTPGNRYKLRTTIPAPGGVGHLRLTIQGR